MSIVYSLILLIFFVLSNYAGSGICIFIISFLQFAILLTYAIKNKHKSVALIFFLLAFFTFFIGQNAIGILLSDQLELLNLEKNPDEEIVAYNAIYLALLSIHIGYYLYIDKFNTYNVLSINIISASHILQKCRRMLLLVFYLTSVFTLIKVAAFVPMILSGGYAKSNVNVPQLTNLLSFLNTFCYVAYLCCFPPRDEVKKSLPLFIILTLSLLAMGTRGNTVCVLLFLIVYFSTRDLCFPSNVKFITKRIKRILIFSFPFCLIGLSLFASIRSGNVVESNGVLYDLLGFFVQQGGTGSLITTADDLKRSLPESNLSYTFGPLINLIQEYTLSGKPSDMDFMVYNALYGNNLGATLTYLTLPSYYFSGGGLGTSYIAELYVDFGYLGIVIYNFLLGILLRYCSFDVKKTLISRIFCSYFLIGMFFLPRDFALNFVRFFTPTYIACFLGVLLIYSYYLHQAKGDFLKQT